MTGLENKINVRIKKALCGMPDVHGHRIELRTGEAGFPDWILFKVGGRTVFIETKFMYDKMDPLKKWTMVQRNWARRKSDMGFKCYVIVGDEEHTLLINAAKCLNQGDSPVIIKTWGKTINSLDLLLEFSK